MTDPIITFTSDFGTKDGYVGAVRGAILSICPQARIFDISHQVPPQDVAHAAFVLFAAAPYFPEGTIHLAVIDPGVGTERRGLCVLCGGHYFVGPDNGLFTPFLGQADAVYSLKNPTFWRKSVSVTFHGRDVFGPVAAHLAAGVGPEDLGPRIDDPETLELWNYLRTGNRIEGAVVHIDHFGNCITNLSPDLLKGGAEYSIWIPGNQEAPEAVALSRTYAEATFGEPCWLVGSSDLIELAVSGGNAASAFHIERGDHVILEIKA